VVVRVERGQAALVVCDLVVSQGADNTYRFRYGTQAADDAETVWVDLTGWSARSQFRYGPGGEVWVSLTSTVPTPLGSTLTLDTDGYVTVHLHHTETEQAAWTSYARRGGVWDVELVDPAGEVVRLAMGSVVVSQDVTRDE
jgi:hypothetical protein